MDQHIEKGKEGERMACTYLERKEFRILARNWRNRYQEIDIIALKNGILHFIEVKTRHSLLYGFPEESVSHKKFNNLKKAATLFLAKNPGCKRIQYDIVSILRIDNKPAEFLLLEDVFLSTQ